jgi:hypothetical protein
MNSDNQNEKYNTKISSMKGNNYLSIRILKKAEDKVNKSNNAVAKEKH